MAKSTPATPALPRLTEALFRRIEHLPAALSIAEIASEFKKPVGTIHQQIRREVFPLRVQDAGGEKFVALADYVKFLSDGEVQAQPAEKRGPGRPTNASKAAAKKNGGGKC